MTENVQELVAKRPLLFKYFEDNAEALFDVADKTIGQHPHHAFVALEFRSEELEQNLMLKFERYIPDGAEKMYSITFSNLSREKEEHLQFCVQERLLQETSGAITNVGWELYSFSSDKKSYHEQEEVHHPYLLKAFEALEAEVTRRGKLKALTEPNQLGYYQKIPFGESSL